VSIAQQAEPWISPGGAAILSGVVLLIAGLIVAIVELRKTRVSQRTLEHQVQPNTGGSMRDAVDKATAASEAIGGKLDGMRDQLHAMDIRLTRIEARTDMIVPTQRTVNHGE
jgi:hypothetical protein